MSEAPLETVTDYLRRVAAPLAARTDADLLALYARDRDEEAFALLVHRHGPMVLGACRRALGASPDAEDAFQATFFALARAPRRVRCSVAGWLYRVAVRASRKALRRRPRAPATEEPADPADPFASLEWREVRRLLDDELDQLPARWRSPLVLTYLEGLSRADAARQLGWSLRTLHRRLDEGRRALRARLGRRGLAPAVLAAAVLSANGLKADVPAPVAQSAAALALGQPVSESVRALVPRVHTWGGLAMKAAVSALILAGGVVLLIGTRQPAGADPKPQEPPPPAVLALAPGKKEKPEDALAKDVRAAQEKAIAYLKAQQKEQRPGVWNWDNDQLGLLQPGGTSSLAVLALLESGLKPDDEVVARGLKYLRTVEPKHTYVVSLQTRALCRANQKQDAEQIKKNVKWLEAAAIRNRGQLEGWTYSTPGGGTRADNSNTAYAVSGLYAAHQAGFKTSDPKFWDAIRNHYIRTQSKDGGWAYTSGARGRPTHTMTVSGVLALTLAKDVLGKEDKAAETARRTGELWIADRLEFLSPPHTFYNFDVIAALGRASEKADFGTKEKKRDWYREGAEWLLKNQKPTGEWKLDPAIDAFPVVSTSFALRFLASRPE